jgi:hypothetical protein
MAITQATVTGPVLFPDGTKPTNGTIYFELASWDRQSGEAVIAPGPISAVLDANGDFSVDLWVTTTGENDTVYVVSVEYLEDPRTTRTVSVGNVAIGTGGPYELSALPLVASWVPASPDILAVVTALAAEAAASETAAAASETAAAASETAAAASLDEFTDLYLGAKASDPTTDNDGDPLQNGALYFNTTVSRMRAYDLSGTIWVDYETAAALSATQAALYDGPKFDDVATMTASPDLAVGDYVIVFDAYNGEPEVFEIVAAATYTANAQEVINLTGISGQAVSLRMWFKTVAELLADPRAGNGVGTIHKAEANAYKEVTSGEVFTTSGGVKLKQLYNTTEGTIPQVRLHVNDGQSNALVKFADDVDGNEPLDRQTPNVIVQHGDTGAWVPAASWKAAPFAGVGAPHGSDAVGGAPNIGLSFAQRFNAEYGGTDYLVTNARSGRSIEAWIDTGTGTPMYDEIKAKIEAALATSELVAAGVTTVTTIVRTQSEEDYNHVSGAGPDGPGDPNYPYMPFVDDPDFNVNTAIYQTYFWALDKYLKRLKGEAWWGPDSVLILNSGSNLHTRYEPMKAMRDFARLHNNVVFVDCSGQPTGGTSAPSDFTHFSGPSIDTIGYYLDFDAYTRRNSATDFSPSLGGLLMNRIGEPYKRGDDTVVFPSDTVLDARLKRVSTPRGLTLTIASGAITVTNSGHAIETEGGAGTDDLDTINGGSDGDILFLRAASSSRDVNVINGGNINVVSSPRTLTTTRGLIQLRYDGSLSEWIEVSFRGA